MNSFARSWIVLSGDRPRMKIELEKEDIKAIALEVVEQLRPMFVANSNVQNPIMDVSELADYLKVKPTWVYKQVEYKSIPHFHAGRYPRFKRKEIEAWVERQSIPDTVAPYPKMKVVKR